MSTLDLGETQGLVRTGHFVYESGHHGDTWLELDALISHPGPLRKLTDRLAESLKGFRANLVCGPLEGGAFVAQLVASSLDLEFVYARRAPAPDPGSPAAYVVPTSFALSGKRVIVVDDAINVGGAALACVQELARRGCEVAALASVFVCSPAGEQVGVLLGIPQVHLVRVPTKLWTPGECPLCRGGMPALTESH